MKQRIITAIGIILVVALPVVADMRHRTDLLPAPIYHLLVATLPHQSIAPEPVPFQMVIAPDTAARQ